MTSSTGDMLVEIDRIFSFGIRRPGHDERLKTEQHLVNRFNEMGLRDIRLEPVPANCWRLCTRPINPFYRSQVIHPEPLDGELAVGTHWVVKIVVMIACVVGFVVVGTGIGFFAFYLADSIGVIDSMDFSWIDLFECMSVFAILSAAIGGRVCYKTIFSK